jgi:hypothetical protein
MFSYFDLFLASRLFGEEEEEEEEVAAFLSKTLSAKAEENALEDVVAPNPAPSFLTTRLCVKNASLSPPPKRRAAARPPLLLSFSFSLSPLLRWWW